MKPIFEIKNLHVSVDGKEILKGINLTLERGKVHALMGRNGSGKTTLAYTIMGHPKYVVTQGEILFKGENMVPLKPHERARKKLFLAFQYPVAIPGVSVGNFLRASMKAVRGGEIPIKEFRTLLKEKMKFLGMADTVVGRYVNDGFSGGEKKKLEVLQLALLEPEITVLDETDSGLDIDALTTVAGGINQLRDSNRSMLVITHYQRLLNYIKPDYVHVLMDGKLVQSGGPELALVLEEKGYDWICQTQN
ncbi:MAG: Fe-S cluster assembly ATPase SufC [Deltaproteobacteria bacterium GWA2_38_16]|nr:MAG: Fe-S cluster assembly ATPase SufC [Deltaproteobacteria bacterium GWA2_38_16]OGQ03234.1 MAG: Fe-S cluster assembly ATPase SufC [Deltaproteobacteria bacterium RIFCSPHIGHO2_02_FULL_38_15]OGQ58752.1 MAG: Fe-S cluster assembly ATPase SufC [Deltaproteobacteria bacterium RIFCSPLOWO2_12_FULL_38_8]HBQ21831.1 Fe-S cluster assembly ATPase SufC [Deltaproteobacteria bacterium]